MCPHWKCFLFRCSSLALSFFYDIPVNFQNVRLVNNFLFFKISQKYEETILTRAFFFLTKPTAVVFKKTNNSYCHVCFCPELDLQIASCIFPQTSSKVLSKSVSLSISSCLSEPSWFPIESLPLQGNSPGCSCGVLRTLTWSRFLRLCTATFTPEMLTCCSTPPRHRHTTYTCGWVRL